VDVIHDLGILPYLFADDEFDEVICCQVIEQVSDATSFVSELHHMMKLSGLIKIVTPHYSNTDCQRIQLIAIISTATPFTRFMPKRTPFPFYSTIELRPLRHQLVLQL
jgi:2-polyprenyl-3-methyl-5-hydroxy-6-metoxy-1,4-benzoquinol methylase